MAVSASVAEIVSDVQDLVLRESVPGGVSHQRIVFVVPLCRKIEGRRPAYVYRVVGEERQDFTVHAAPLRPVGVEDELVFDLRGGAEQREGHHTRLVELHRVAGVFGIPVFFTKV